jgi:hypothetical protein
MDADNMPATVSGKLAETGLLISRRHHESSRRSDIKRGAGFHG